VTSSTGSTVYSGTSVDTAWDDAFTYVASGGNITVDPGTYIGTLQHPSTGIYGGLYGDCYSGFIAAYLNNVNINFQSGAILTIVNNMGAYSVWSFWYCNNVLITGATINGNAANEPVGQTTDGILVYDCNNTVVTHSTLYNCRNYGWSDGSNYQDVVTPCGITDCTVYDCYWNGICFDDTRISGDYAIGNTIYNCSDVGISCYGGTSVTILDNYIYNINGTDGWAGAGTGSHYGIALEGGYQCLVENNTIINCPSNGICDGDDVANPYDNLIIGNHISGSAQGINVWTSGYDVITQNTITGWSASGGNDAILVMGYESYLSPNIIISYNTIGSPTGSAGTAYGIVDNGASNCSICDNTMTIPTSDTYVYGIYLATFENVGANYNLIEGNNAQAHYGIYIADSGCTDNKINGNTLTNCTTQITNDGTGTITNPSSSSTYSLTLNDPYSTVTVTPAQGTHVYSSGAQPVITVSPTSGYTLNIEGSNVTLTSGTYKLTMNQDNFAYVISTTSIP
jgi:hypothetical protein